jgi:hypothetical protein
MVDREAAGPQCTAAHTAMRLARHQVIKGGALAVQAS